VAAVAPVAGAAKLVTPPSTGSTEFLGSLLELGSGRADLLLIRQDQSRDHPFDLGDLPAYNIGFLSMTRSPGMGSSQAMARLSGESTIAVFPLAETYHGRENDRCASAPPGGEDA
jgi:hypothetical protein